MNNSITELVETIDSCLVKLAELIKEDYISASFINNAVMITSAIKDDKQKLEYYRKLEVNNE